MIRAACEVVGGAAQPNSGVPVDSWHFFKAGQTVEALADVPGHCLHAMQISDAPLRQIGPTLIGDTMEHRRWPGQGELPVADPIRAVAAQGHLRAIGQEVFSLEADAMPPQEAGRIAGETTWAAFRAAGVAVPAAGNGAR